jgi:probable phosphoglycerate mutase
VGYEVDDETAIDNGAYRQIHYQRPADATDIFLIRHGESEAIAADAPFEEVGGRADPALAEAGTIQAQQVGRRLKIEAIEAIYVSPLRRTHQTAAPLAEALGLRPVVEAGLVEVDLGDWEGGMFRKMLHDKHPLVERLWAEERWDVIPGAEPAGVFASRVRDTMETIAQRHVGQTVAVFSHGGVIAQILSDACGATPFAFVDVDNGSISQVVVRDAAWKVRRYNDTTHMSRSLRLVAEPLL